MHPLNKALVEWRNKVKKVLDDEGVTYFNCKFSCDASSEHPKFEVWFSLPGKNYGFSTSTIEGADPDDVITELVHRISFQRQQQAVCLPSPVTLE